MQACFLWCALSGVHCTCVCESYWHVNQCGCYPHVVAAPAPSASFIMCWPFLCQPVNDGEAEVLAEVLWQQRPLRYPESVHLCTNASVTFQHCTPAVASCCADHLEDTQTYGRRLLLHSTLHTHVLHLSPVNNAFYTENKFCPRQQKLSIDCALPLRATGVFITVIDLFIFFPPKPFL